MRSDARLISFSDFRPRVERFFLSIAGVVGEISCDFSSVSAAGITAVSAGIISFSSISPNSKVICVRDLPITIHKDTNAICSNRQLCNGVEKLLAVCELEQAGLWCG